MFSPTSRGCPQDPEALSLHPGIHGKTTGRERNQSQKLIREKPGYI